MIKEELFQWHEECAETRLSHRRFKHADLMPIIEGLRLEKELIGHSFEGRPIFKIKVGSGPIQVLLWSQMHGDEATATMALFDLFQFFEQKNNAFVDLIKSKLTLHFVPMLNPDGAERFMRRTAQQIDMNRDALALICPESRLLKKLQDEIKPAFSFNLHDQNTRYSAGKSAKQASISFLATAYNEEREWNENRIKSMQVICAMNAFLQTILPDGVGRFSDEFEPRAFGDNIQKWGSSLILIESGGFREDREKQYLRKLNFVLMLKAFESIASQSFLKHVLEEYESIPLNEKCLFDLLIRNANYKGNQVDIGINLYESNTEDIRGYTLSSSVDDFGDLSTFWGIQELDACGMEVVSLSGFLENLTRFGEIEIPEIEIEFEKKANFALVRNQKPVYYIIDGRLTEAK